MTQNAHGIYYMLCVRCILKQFKNRSKVVDMVNLSKLGTKKHDSRPKDNVLIKCLLNNLLRISVQ